VGGRATEAESEKEAFQNQEALIGATTKETGLQLLMTKEDYALNSILKDVPQVGPPMGRGEGEQE
jgi:hypothetical protein